jgi:hexokinase
MRSLKNSDASNFAHGEVGPHMLGNLHHEALSESDKDIIRAVYNSVVDRAALFTSVNILVGVVKSGEGMDAAHPVCVNIDGSTWDKTYGLKKKVLRRLADMTKERGLYIECIDDVDEAPIVGAAIAGLTGL